MKGVKAIGLAVLAVLAMGALSASPAAASSVVSTAGGTTYVGSGNGQLKLAGWERTCSEASFTGALGSERSTSFTPSSQYIGECGYGEALQMNGCSMTYKPGVETAPGVYGGTIDIGPSNCGPMTIKKWGAAWCASYAYSVYPKSDIPAEFVNLESGGSKTVKVRIHATGLKVEAPPPSKGCGSSGENGSYEGSWVMSPASGNLYVDGASGFFLAGEASAEPAKQPRFEGERSPQAVRGQEDASVLPKFTAGKLTTTCKQAEFEGTLSGAAKALGLSASYDECKSGTIPAVVRMNTCSYTLNALNVGPPYAGSLDVACTKVGDAIEVRTYASVAKMEEDKPICIASIGAQTGLGNIGLANLGSGSSRAVDVTPSLSGYTYNYTRLSAVCPGSAGTFSDGQYVGDTTLNGAY